jgi:hypothetical protein
MAGFNDPNDQWHKGGAGGGTSIFDMGLNLPSVFKDQQNQAMQQYQAKLAALAAQEGQTALNFGFKYNRGDDGSLKDFQIDPNLMHSQAMNLMQSHADNLGTLRNQLAGQHLGRTGLAKQRELLLRFLNGGDTQNLANSFQSQLSGIQGQRGQAAWDMNSAMSAAELAAMQYAMQNGLFAPAGSSAPAGISLPQASSNAGYTNSQTGSFVPTAAPDQGYFTSSVQGGYAPAPTRPQARPTGGGRAVSY